MYNWQSPLYIKLAFCMFTTQWYKAIQGKISRFAPEFIIIPRKIGISADEKKRKNRRKFKGDWVGGVTVLPIVSIFYKNSGTRTKRILAGKNRLCSYQFVIHSLSTNGSKRKCLYTAKKIILCKNIRG